jgi:hypothetical protein
MAVVFIHSSKDRWEERTAGHVVDLCGEASFFLDVIHQRLLVLAFMLSQAQDWVLFCQEKRTLPCCKERNHS